MAQVNKISSFKSFTEIKNQEATMKLREENNAKRQETVGKIGAILDEMGLTSLSELDEEKKQALISKMFGNVSEDEAEDIEDEINKLGEPKKLEEGNAFIYAASKAKQEGKTEFEFNGKKYKVTLKKDTGLKEGNAFEEFEFKGETYRVEESLNEGKHGMAKKLLKAIMNGDSSEAEGIKMSKDLAEHYLYWINTSPYGKKNENLPLYMLVKASFNWGIERGLDPKLKGELNALKGSIKESVESIDEARSINKIQYDWSKLTTTMAATVQNWKAAEGPAKEALLGKLKEMTAQKKALEAELDAAIADKDKDIELVVTEGEVNEAEIKSDDEFKEYAMTVLKKAFGADFDEAKATEVADGILGKVDGDYGAAVGMLTSSLGESVVNEGDMTKFYDGFIIRDRENKKTYKFRYVKGISNARVEVAAIDKLVKATGLSQANFAVSGFVKKGEWNSDKTDVLESTVTEGFDANYWEDYHEDAEKITRISDMVIKHEVEACAEEWNDNNEVGPENEITPKIEKKVIEKAKQFAKAKGWISSDVIEAMLAQEA